VPAFGSGTRDLKREEQSASTGWNSNEREAREAVEIIFGIYRAVRPSRAPLTSRTLEGS
jgi:hypothetical protein